MLAAARVSPQGRTPSGSNSRAPISTSSLVLSGQRLRARPPPSLYPRGGGAAGTVSTAPESPVDQQVEVSESSGEDDSDAASDSDSFSDEEIAVVMCRECEDAVDSTRRNEQGLCDACFEKSKTPAVATLSTDESKAQHRRKQRSAPTKATLSTDDSQACAMQFTH
mgnify:CR=1 FL=1